MSFRDYLQHGSRHRPDGSDPIPGLASGASGLSWAYISSNGSPVSCPSSTNTRIAADSSNFYTNAPSTFDAHNSGGGVMGMRLLEDGHYLFWMAAIPSTSPKPSAGDLYQLTVEGGGEFADFNFAPWAMVFPSGGNAAAGTLLSGGVMNVGGFISSPTDAIVCRIDNLSSHNFDFIYQGLVAIQLDTTSTDLN